MSNSNDVVNTSYEKKLNFAATSILLIWIIVIILGIFSLINAILNLNVMYIWSLSYNNPLLYIVFIIGFFTSRSVSFSIINLIKNRQWIKSSNFIKSILIQLVIVTIASILTIIFYESNNFTVFFSLFTSFTVLFSIAYLVFCVRYYRYDVPERQTFRDPSQRGHI